MAGGNAPSPRSLLTAGVMLMMTTTALMHTPAASERPTNGAMWLVSLRTIRKERAEGEILQI